MRRAFGIAAVLAALGQFAIASSQVDGAATPKFKSAELLSVSDVPIPFNSVANGIVLLHATIDKTGKVTELAVVGELASVNRVASDAVKSWSFSPGAVDGKPAVTRLTIAVVFCPLNRSSNQIPLSPLSSAQLATPRGTFPSHLPDVTAAEYPRSQDIFSGTVALQAVIGPRGDLDYAKVVKDVPGLTAPSLTAVKEKWSFKPAEIAGKPVGTIMVIVFAFRVPYSGNL